MTKTSPAAQGTVADVEAAFRRHIEANDYAKDLIKRIAFDIVPMVRALAPSPEALPASGVEVPPCWWIDHGSYGQITQRPDEAQRAADEGKRVVAYTAALLPPATSGAPAPSGSGVELKVLKPLSVAISMADDWNKAHPDEKRSCKDFILDSELRTLIASLASDASPRGESSEIDIRREAYQQGWSTALAAHPAPAPAPAEVVEGVRKAVKSAMTTCHDKGYGVAMSANAEECFVTALLMTALASPAPVTETEGRHG